MKCDEIRERIEAGNDDFRMREHLGACAACTEYGALQAWSARVVQAGRVEAAPPLMSEVWASIHRATAQAWDSALTRSFRRLFPFMLALTALLVLVGVLQPFGSTKTVEPTGLSNPLAGLDNPPVAALVNTPLTPRTPSDLLGVGH